MGLFDWNNKDANEGLSAGPKDSPSENGSGVQWSRGDGTSGQSQTHKSDDGTVTHWQHDRDNNGGEEISTTTYHPNGSTTFGGHAKH